MGRTMVREGQNLQTREVEAELSVGGEGVVIGTLVRLSPVDRPSVRLSAPVDAIVQARSCVALTPDHVGRPVVVVFERGRVDCPIVLGVIQLDNRAPAGSSPVAFPAGLSVDIDGRTVLAGSEEIVLRCGAASIHLTRAGKILIRGAYLSTQSTGVHRIKGATVEIN